ncbi:MAG TPA: PilZ domain-containing protein [Lysobacter sp.]|nr:PilZ domain-containing protein [Lysobacter sp.]
MELPLELRRYPREEVFSAVMFVPDGHNAMALDLSAGGARVGLIDEWRPSPGSVLPVSFLFDTDQPIVLQCRVTRVAVDHVGMAFEPEQDESIQRLLVAARVLH